MARRRSRGIRCSGSRGLAGGTQGLGLAAARHPDTPAGARRIGGENACTLTFTQVKAPLPGFCKVALLRLFLAAPLGLAHPSCETAKALDLRGTLRGRMTPDGASSGSSPLACASVLPAQRMYLCQENHPA